MFCGRIVSELRIVTAPVPIFQVFSDRVGLAALPLFRDVRRRSFIDFRLAMVLVEIPFIGRNSRRGDVV